MLEISNFLRDISILIASITAILGISAWRREFKWKKRAELAEEVLILFYEARDAIRHIRNPFGFGNEGTTRKQNENETEEEKAAYDRAYVAIERYNNYQELFSKIGALKYRFMIYFGKDTEKPFSEIIQVINEIFFASRTLARLWVRSSRIINPRTEEQLEKLHSDIEKYEAIFWQTLPEEDAIDPKVEKAVQAMESKCNAILHSSIIKYPTKFSTIFEYIKRICNKFFSSKSNQ